MACCNLNSQIDLIICSHCIWPRRKVSYNLYNWKLYNLVACVSIKLHCKNCLQLLIFSLVFLSYFELSLHHQPGFELELLKWSAGVWFAEEVAKTNVVVKCVPGSVPSSDTKSASTRATAAPTRSCSTAPPAS